MLTAIQYPPHPLLPPAMLPYDATGGGFATNAATKALAAYICLWPGETIAELSAVSYANATGAASNYILGVEGIVNNVPDGTYKSFGNAKTVNTLVTSALNTQTRIWTALTAPYQNVGSTPEFLALTLRSGATGFTAANYGTFLQQMNCNQALANCFPWSGTYDGASWSVGFGRPGIAARDASGLLVGNTFNGKGFTGIHYNTGSGSPQIRGVKWTAREFSVLSAIMLVMRPQTSADFQLHVYHTPRGGAQTLVSSTTYTKSVMPGGTSDVGSLLFPLPKLTVAPFDIVRIVYQPLTATSNTFWGRINFPDAAALSTYLRQPLGDTPFLHYTTAVNKAGADAGTWTDATDQLPSMIPCIEQISTPFRSFR